MVWFQCEDCGENLKKPKLPNHFRMCSATKVFSIFPFFLFKKKYWSQIKNSGMFGMLKLCSYLALIVERHLGSKAFRATLSALPRR